MKFSVFMAFSCTLGISLLFSSSFFTLTSYLHPLVLVVVFCCIFFLVFFLMLVSQKETIKLSYTLFSSILTAYTIALLILLFFRPNNQTYLEWNLIPFSTISFYLSGKVKWMIAFYNLAANIGLFISYGFFLMLKHAKSKVIRFLLPFICIVLIEILQFLSNRGSLDIDDLILNLLGVYIGYWLSPLFFRVIKIK